MLVCLRRAVVPQVSHGFGADQREDDVVVLLTLEPVHRRHLRRKEEVVNNSNEAWTLSPHSYAHLCHVAGWKEI